MNKLILIVLIIVSFQAIGADKVWLGPERSKWSDTEFRKTKNDFTGLFLVTPDTDWERKWNTPPDTIPYFREATSVRIGEELVILTFFVNPKPDVDGNGNALCNIKATRPNDTISVDKKTFPA